MCLVHSATQRMIPENLGKVTSKADIGISLDMLPRKKDSKIYNSLYYPQRTRRIIETIHVDFDELTAMASEHSSSGPALHEMTPVTISSGLVPNPPSSTPFVPPSRSDWDLLFQPMFDESLNPTLNAPYPSNSHTTQETQTPIISHDVEEENHDIEVAHMGNDPYFGIPIPEVTSDQSSSSDIIHTIVPPDHQVSEHNSKWTKDHPLENIIVDLRIQRRFNSSYVGFDAMQEELQNLNIGRGILKNKKLGWSLVVIVRRGNDFEGHHSDKPNYVYTLKKALYGLKQATTHVGMICCPYILVSNGVLIKAQWILTHVHRRRGKISQSPRGIFINQSKYALESLKKYGFESCDPMDTPMVEKSKLDEDKEGKVVDPSHYRGMIGTLLYLTASRPNLQFAICMCARYQARPTEKHLNAVKRIFRYLKGTVHRGLWYPKDSSFALTTFADADHAGCQDTRRSTSGSIQLLGDRLVSWSSKRQKSAAISSTEAEYIACFVRMLCSSPLDEITKTYDFGIWI
ncbi:hypothetical protein Tco_1312346 [Tanacetum coccineum]